MQLLKTPMKIYQEVVKEIQEVIEKNILIEGCIELEDFQTQNMYDSEQYPESVIFWMDIVRRILIILRKQLQTMKNLDIMQSNNLDRNPFNQSEDGTFKIHLGSI